jgi:predicted phage baseplate assembly protein
MSNGTASADGQPCGCCTGLTHQTPEAIANRPALPSITYRAGRYSTFNASMLAALSDPAFPPLAALRTRDPTDFSIALIDAWAVALDILTFYQERFANEAYLRTAVDQRSVLELAGLVGYVPSPGVAASAVLAFTLSSVAGSPDNVLIPAGSRVQSVPGPGQTAQTFETSADLTAVIGWNALPAQTTAQWQLAGSDTSTWIAGTANNINVGDALLFVQAQAGQPSPTGPADFHYVTAVAPDPSVSRNTQIWWDEPLSDAFTAGQDASQVCLYVFRKKAALYGAQAPSPQLLSGPGISQVPGYQTETTSQGTFPTVTWNYAQYTRGSYQINLDVSYPGLAPPASAADGPPQWLVLTSPGLTYYETPINTSFFQISAVAESSPDLYTLTAKTTQLTLNSNAGQVVPAVSAVTAADLPAAIDFLLTLYVAVTPNVTAYVQSAPLTLVDLPLTSWNQDSAYPRQAGMLTPVSGSAVPVTGGQQIAPGQPVGVSGKYLRIQVSGSPPNGTFTPAGQSGGSAAAAGQVFVTGSFPPATDPATGNLLWTVTTLSGVAGTLNVPAGQFTLLPAATTDPLAGEAAAVQSVSVSGDIATLTLNGPLNGIYDASTVKVNANAVLATNGQTVQEILGSADATNPALQFTLKQAPLTCLPAPNGNGSVSSLQVWVNNLQWHETASLLTAGPADRVYVTSTNASGRTVVQFGNGVQGARPPTGVANIRAVYRKGIGSAGMVSAGQLSLPLDRPQGLSLVANPSAASGAADPATPSQARASAPLPTLTVGRVVSLQDYQNYALGFAGIGMALATWTWLGAVRGVFLTVAGVGGAVLSEDDPVVTGLAAAIRLSGDPYVPLQIAPYRPVPFTFTAAVVVDQANYAPAQVLVQAWQDLAAAFAFGQRQFGQGVAASEIIEIIQQVAGVTAVQLSGLGRSGAAPQGPGPAMLCVSGPQPPDGAELLRLDPATQGQIGVWSP